MQDVRLEYFPQIMEDKRCVTFREEKEGACNRVEWSGRLQASLKIVSL